MKKATFTLMFLLATSVAMEPLWAQSGRQNPKAGASDSGKATAAENQADTESDDEAGEEIVRWVMGCVSCATAVVSRRMSVFAKNKMYRALLART